MTSWRSASSAGLVSRPPVQRNSLPQTDRTRPVAVVAFAATAASAVAIVAGDNHACAALDTDTGQYPVTYPSNRPLFFFMAIGTDQTRSRKTLP